MKQKAILINTVKISIAAILSILCAQLFKLDFAVSAGIVAILSVQPTKKETFRTAFDRLFAFAIALIISSVCFNLFGFTIPVFFIYLLIFILICQIFGWVSAMAMDSVLISHFLNFGKMGFFEIRNEAALFLIGVSFGILVNLTLHKKTDYIEGLKTNTDNIIKQTLFRMSQRILDVELADYDGKCFISLNKAIFTAKSQAEENYKNQFSNDDYDRLYLAMREKQIQVLHEMYKCVREIKTVPSTAILVADFLKKVSEEYHKDNDVKNLLTELSEISQKMKQVALPVTRNEFEDRANLFILLSRLEEFLTLKKDFMEGQQLKSSKPAQDPQ